MPWWWMPKKAERTIHQQQTAHREEKRDDVEDINVQIQNKEKKNRKMKWPCWVTICILR